MFKNGRAQGSGHMAKQLPWTMVEGFCEQKTSTLHLCILEIFVCQLKTKLFILTESYTLDDKR